MLPTVCARRQLGASLSNDSCDLKRAPKRKYDDTGLGREVIDD
jgi:hypothetical protein